MAAVRGDEGSYLADLIAAGRRTELVHENYFMWICK